MNESRTALLRQLDYHFRDEALLVEALTHRSAGTPNNERLEFLGDALLNWVIAESLHGMHPTANEGDLTRLRASLVRESSLADIASELQLGNFLVLGPGERRSGGFRRHSILADGLEAVLAAVYLDGGFEAARAVIERIFRERLEESPDTESLKDAKTRLQEFLQGRGLALPDYEVLEITGHSHQQRFHVRCSVAGGHVAEGEGKSRRKAEQAAAEKILERLQESP